MKPRPLVARLLSALAFTALFAAHGSVHAQASQPTGDPPVTAIPAPGADTTPAANSARNTSTSTLTDVQSSSVRRLTGTRDPVVGDVGTGRAIGDGSRVLRVPGKCDPKTNSLDCVTDSNAAQSGGANVSNRVRNSVIGEVGSGRSATEGSGKTKGQATCTPAPGQLSCEPGK
ncbi:MAG: hypothetical protein EPO12_11885 [Aquabacterium sp.]|nr:MAG: hypothetical protein EPO12_11885 [Aquabacterium sp.]